jgi:hypothetical protein
VDCGRWRALRAKSPVCTVRRFMCGRMERLLRRNRDRRFARRKQIVAWVLGVAGQVSASAPSAGKFNTVLGQGRAAQVLHHQRRLIMPVSPCESGWPKKIVASLPLGHRQKHHQRIGFGARKATRISLPDAVFGRSGSISITRGTL